MIRFQTKFASNTPYGAAMLAPGFYSASIVDAYEDYNEQYNYQTLKLTFAIQDGSYKQDGSANTVEVKNTLANTEKMAWKIEQLLASLGKKFAAKENIEFDARKLVGRKLTVATYKQKSAKNGRLYAQILRYLRPDDVPHIGAMTPEELQEYNLTASGESVYEQEREAQRNNAASPYANNASPACYQQPARQTYERRSFSPQQNYAAPTGYAAAHNGAQDEADDDLPF